ncbi:MAG: carbonic anhydrase family protein [Renibacterium salmoninarum]|nr:carbonic anhydrase family protein [Renibacterium salmoninarum]
MKLSIKRVAATVAVSTGLLFISTAPAFAQYSPITIDERDTQLTQLAPIIYNNFSTTGKNIPMTVTYSSGSPEAGQEGPSEAGVRAVPYYNTNYSITMQGITYKLDNVHWHTKSEHILTTVSPSKLPMEQHMVFKGPGYRDVVLSSLMEIGNSQTATNVEKIISAASTSSSAPTYAYNVNLNSLINPSTDRYQYTGSATTWPHSNNVTWIISKSPLRVQQSTVDKYQSMLPLGDDGKPVNSRDFTTPIFHSK